MSEPDDELVPDQAVLSAGAGKSFNNLPGVSVVQVAERCNGLVIGNEETQLFGVSPIDAAQSGTLSFFNGRSAERFVAEPQPTAVLVTAENAVHFQCVRIVVGDPYLAYAKVSKLFDPARVNTAVGIDKTAIVHPDVLLDDGVSIGPYSVVGSNCRIGKNTQLGSHVIIDANCEIGHGCRIGSRVTLRANTKVGSRCRLSSGVVIGACGFGYAPSKEGWQAIAQLGGVTLGDDVDIGANTTIDRGAINDTVIGNRVKLDNQIQIAHNVKVGDDTIMAGCVAIAGSTEIGAKCQLGGRASVLGHLKIADETILNAGAFVASSIEQSGTYSSMIPAQPVAKWRKTVAYLNRLGKLFRN